MNRRFDLNAGVVGLVLGGLVLLGIFVGSGGGQSFDPELTFYAIGSSLAAAAVGYRFSVWSQRPPTRRYLMRGIGFIADGKWPAGQKASRTSRVVADKVVAQNFIRHRSWYRWVMHLCLSGGCTLAFAITFPLVFGWVHFAPDGGDATVYTVKVLGLSVDRFAVESFKAFLMFNLLNIAGLIVLVGVVMALGRRISDAGERATQTFFEDFLPLLLILAVTVTGLGLTVSYKFMEGSGHGFLAVVHLVTVLALLFYIPFGKLFHMFQRIVSVFVGLYKQEGERTPQAACARCLLPFASVMHVEDLKEVLDQLGFNYRYQVEGHELHYQDICPSCRRRLIALNQGHAIGR